jgi:glycosyltransferase involved in cell wall biosynthesis
MNSNGRKLRIAQIAPIATSIPPPKSGSVELMTSLLTEGLVKLGHDVTLFATGDSITEAKLHSLYPKGYWDDIDMYPWEFYEMTNVSAACEIAENFDIIHYQAAYYPMSLAFFRLVKTPFLQTVHHYPDADEVRLWNRFPEANFVAISECQKVQLQGVNCVGTVYHGIETEKFTFREKPENYILFLGRFTEGKGVLQAIEVAKRLEIQLLLAAPEDDYYHESVKQHIDGELIRYVGEVDSAERDRLLGGAIALIYPVQVGEPFGLVLVEAMACGTPVLALDKGAVSEIVVNGLNGYRVETLDEMVSIFPKVIEIDRRKVRDFAVERFDVMRMVGDYVKVYEKIIDGK